MYLHFLALGFLALCIATGLLYRVACGLFFLGFAYVFLLDKANYLNHFYLIALIALLMTFVPAHRRFSLDALVRPETGSETAPRWALWLLRGQLALVYFFGGVAKLNGDWLRGSPLDQWLAAHAGAPLVGPLLAEHTTALLFSYGGLLLDLLIAPLLLWRRTRPYAFAGAVAFHLMNSQIFSIGIFPWMMIAATTLFLPPDWPRRLVARLRRASPPEGPAPRTAPEPARFTTARRVGVAVLATYFAVQILVPFRHVLYPGTVHWTEEGHRFSWHMKLRDKTPVAARFLVRDRTTGVERPVDPDDYLSDRQSVKMSTRPDMLLQFAHHLAGHFTPPGGPRPEVRAETLVSLNGRPPQPLVDPRADLAAEPRTLRPARWIVPLRQPEPPEAKPSSADPVDPSS